MNKSVPTNFDNLLTLFLYIVTDYIYLWEKNVHSVSHNVNMNYESSLKL